MDQLLLRLLVFAGVGVVSGFAAGLFSIGGGVIRVPVFVHLLPLFGVPYPIVMHVSVATSLALVVPSSVVSMRKHRAEGTLDFAYLPTWLIGLVVGVAIGAALLPLLSTFALKVIFILFLLATATYLGFSGDSSATEREPPQGAAKVGVAAAIGCLAQLTGTGGGLATTGTLKAFGVSLERILAISSATTFVVGIVSTVGAIITGWHAPGRPPYSLGYVDLVVWAAMVPTVLIAAPLGVRWGHRLRRKVLTRLLTALLLGTAIEMAIKLVHEP